MFYTTHSCKLPDWLIQKDYATHTPLCLSMNSIHDVNERVTNAFEGVNAFNEERHTREQSKNQKITRISLSEILLIRRNICALTVQILK